MEHSNKGDDPKMLPHSNEGDDPEMLPHSNEGDDPKTLPPLPPLLPLPQLHRYRADNVDAGNVPCTKCNINFVSHNRCCTTCDDCTNNNGCGCDTISVI